MFTNKTVLNKDLAHFTSIKNLNSRNDLDELKGVGGRSRVRGGDLTFASVAQKSLTRSIHLSLTVLFGCLMEMLKKAVSVRLLSCSQREIDRETC